jgi:hypothetical protein
MLSRNTTAGVLISLSFLTALGCQKRRPLAQTAIKAAEATPQSIEMVAKIERGCASGGCHGGDAAGHMPFEKLSEFAAQTAGYHGCLLTRQCFGNLDQTSARLCWDCITGAGNLNLNGGIYQAAIDHGIVKKIADAAGVTTSGNNIDPNYQIALNGSMPQGGTLDEAGDLAANQAKFQEMATWLTSEFDNNYPNIRALRAPSTDPDESLQDATCDEFSPVVAQNVLTDFSMEGLSMFGCPDSGWPDDAGRCLSNVADTRWADAGTPGLTVKVLRTLTNRPASSYWTRSSADGRYVATGNGRIEDLKIADRSIQVNGGSIDPAFSPDNKFYLWPSMICPQSPLNDGVLTTTGPSVQASGCVSDGSVGVYASLAKDSSGDLLVIQGYTNNNSGNGSRDNNGTLRAGTKLKIRRLTNGRFSGATTQHSTPYESDYQVSPSGKLLVGRFNHKITGQGYRVRVMRPDGTTIAPENKSTSGVICMKGEKANISYDGRFVTFHHYSDGSPQDIGTPAGTSNIFIYDILKKRGVRVTNMSGDSKAFFPHFRADGWLMFLIKGTTGQPESIAASNATFVLKNMP